MNFYSITVLLSILVHTSIAQSQNVQTVSKVDLQQYLGKWFEIARFPQRFQENCDQAEANYKMGEAGRIIVENRCVDTRNGSIRIVEGDAEVVDSTSNAKLKVSFVPTWMRWTGIGRGDYWIIDLAPDYSYAVVSEPNREYLWILSRTASMNAATFDGIKSKLVSMGYDLHKLIPARSNHIQ